MNWERKFRGHYKGKLLGRGLKEASLNAFDGENDDVKQKKWLFEGHIHVKINPFVWSDPGTWERASRAEV